MSISNIETGRVTLGLTLLGSPLQSGKAQSEHKNLAQRVKDLEYKLRYVTGGNDEVVNTGANLRIINGLGNTETTNGLGNLIVGYNEPRNILDILTCVRVRTTWWWGRSTISRDLGEWWSASLTGVSHLLHGLLTRL